MTRSENMFAFTTCLAAVACIVMSAVAIGTTAQLKDERMRASLAEMRAEANARIATNNADAAVTLGERLKACGATAQLYLERWQLAENRFARERLDVERMIGPSYALPAGPRRTPVFERGRRFD